METFLVIGIVGIVAVMAGRSFYRTLAGKGDGCGCTGTCAGCACSEAAQKEPERDDTP